MSLTRAWQLPGNGSDRIALVWRPRPSEPRGKRLTKHELTTLLRRWLADSSTERRLREIHAWARGAPDIRVAGRDPDAALRRYLEAAIDDGVLVGYREPFGNMRLPQMPDQPIPPLPRTEPPGERPAGPTYFEVRFVDEIGEAIGGAAISFEVDGQHPRATDGDGRARLDGVTAQFGSVKATDLYGLREILRPRWDQIRDEPWLEAAADHTFCALRTERDVRASMPSETLHTIVVQPWCIRARLIGMYFDTNKCFLLPAAMPGIRGVKRLYDDNPDSALLIVGHTDTTGGPWDNDPLSVERADSVAAYLTDDVEAWMRWYDPGITWWKRWGTTEDHMMIAALPDYPTRTEDEPPIHWFQRTRGLPTSGMADATTRREIVKAYMSLDDTTLPPGVVPIVHGAGENFPIEQQGGAQPVDARAAQWNRRVELYFFDGTLGVQPSPPGLSSAPGSRAYPEWVRRASETHDFEVLRKEILELRLHDDDIHPWPHVYARADMGGEPQYLQADESGWVAIALPAACPERITVRWGAATPAASHPFERDVFVRCSEGSDAYQAEARLHNVGYDRRLDLEAAARCFQVDYGVDHEPEPLGLVNGLLPPATRERLDAIFAELECDATSPPQ